MPHPEQPALAASDRAPWGLIAFAAALALVGTVLVHHVAITPLDDAAATGWITALHALPLVILLPGLARRRPRAQFFAAMLATIYFVFGIDALLPTVSRTIGVIEVALSLVVFATAAVAARTENARTR